MRQEEHGGGRKELPFVAITQTGFYFSKASLCLRHFFFGGGGEARLACSANWHKPEEKLNRNLTNCLITHDSFFMSVTIRKYLVSGTEISLIESISFVAP